MFSSFIVKQKKTRLGVHFRMTIVLINVFEREKANSAH